MEYFILLITNMRLLLCVSYFFMELPAIFNMGDLIICAFPFPMWCAGLGLYSLSMETGDR